MIVASWITNLISGFFEDILNELLSYVDNLLVDLADVALNAENYMTGTMGLTINFTTVSSVILSYALALAVLKFAQKGFTIYILQSAGDSDHDPLTLLTGFFMAVAVAVTSLDIYPYVIEVFEAFLNKMLKSFSVTNASLTDALNFMTSSVLVGVLVVIVYAILLLVLYISLIMDGAELLVLKYAMPFLCMGLMDSDGGTFKTAVKKFLQAGFTVVLKIILLKLSVTILLTGHPIWAIAFALLAMKAPKILHEFLFIRSGGGGAVAKIHALTAIKSLVK